MTPRRITMKERGFTLVETLVAITVAAVVLTGLATTVSNQGRSAIFQMGSADAAQNVRGALDMFKREVRMAGFGMGAIPTAALEPVLVQAAGAGEAYRVRLRGALSNVQTFGSGVNGTITLDAASCPAPVATTCPFVVGRYVSIESAILGSAEVGTISGWNAGTKTLTLAPNLTKVYAAGSFVRQIDDVLYVLDTQGILRRTVMPAGAGDVVSDQITGANALTLQYILADGTTVANPAANLATLRSATIRMIASGSTYSGQTPQMDMTAEVRIRNLGIATAPSL